MNVGTRHSERSSAATLRSARPRENRLSEAEFLAREIADAKAALAHTTGDLQGSLRATADLRPWARQYPWAALGVAAVTGFTAATVVTPAPGQSVRDKWSELVRAGQPCEATTPAEQADSQPPTHARVVPTILSSLFDLAKLVAQTVVISMVRSQSTPRDSGDTPY